MFKLLLYGMILSEIFLSIAYAGLSLYPVRQEVTLPPGGKFKGTYTIKNTFEKPITMQVSYRDWFVLPENKNITVNDWLTVSPTEFYMLSNEEKNVDYEIRLPTSTIGFTSAMISFMPKPEGDQQINMMLSGSLYAIASGTEKYEWDFIDVKITFTSPTLTVEATLKNTGNIHVRPEGILKIYKGQKEICSGIFEQGKPIYPGNSRNILGSANDCFLKEGNYSAQLLLHDAVGNTAETKVNFKVKNNGEVVTQ